MPSAPPVYLDECVDHDLVDALRARGFVVGAAVDEGMDGQSVKDRQQLEYATVTGRLILTHNETHFWQLHVGYRRERPLRLHGGILVLPQDVDFLVLVVRAAMMLDWLGMLGQHAGRFFKWGRLQHELIHGLHLPGYTTSELRLVLGQTP